jgi:hypothetical protein
MAAPTSWGNVNGRAGPPGGSRACAAAAPAVRSRHDGPHGPQGGAQVGGVTPKRVHGLAVGMGWRFDWPRTCPTRLPRGVLSCHSRPEGPYYTAPKAVGRFSQQGTTTPVGTNAHAPRARAKTVPLDERRQAQRPYPVPRGTASRTGTYPIRLPIGRGPAAGLDEVRQA